MPRYAVDSDKMSLTATGIVEPVAEWEDSPTGGRRPSERQAMDEETRLPLWNVEVMYGQISFGRESTVTAWVKVPAAAMPEVEKFQPVPFEGLIVEVRTNKAGGFRENWEATNVKTPGSRKPAQVAGAA